MREISNYILLKAIERWDEIESKELVESIILARRNARLSYSFAKYVGGSNIKKHEQIVLESKIPFFNYRFAKDVKDADVLAHGQVIIENGIAEDNYLFALNVKGANIKAHGKAIIESKNSEYIYLFAYYVLSSDDDIKPYEDALLANRDSKYSELFMKNIKGANWKKHLEVIEQNSRDEDYSSHADNLKLLLGIRK